MHSPVSSWQMPLFVQEGQWKLQEGPHFSASHPFMEKYNGIFVVFLFSNPPSCNILFRANSRIHRSTIYMDCHTPVNWTTVVSKIAVTSNSKFGPLPLFIHNYWKYRVDIHKSNVCYHNKYFLYSVRYLNSYLFFYISFIFLSKLTEYNFLYIYYRAVWAAKYVKY